MTSTSRSSDDQSERAQGAQNDDEEMSEVIRSFDDADWRLRLEAIQRVRGNPEAIALVLQAMREDHGNLRVLNSAISVVTENGADTVAALVEFLTDPDPQLRIAATLALGERRSPKAIPAVLAALGDSDPNVQFHAVEALGKLRAGDSVNQLVSIARSKDFNLAAPALDSLGKIGDGCVAHELIGLLDDALLQPAVVECLGLIGDEESAVALTRLLNSQAAPVIDVARALQTIWQRFETQYKRGDLIAQVVAKSLDPTGIRSMLETAAEIRPAEVPPLLAVMGWIDGSCLDAPLAAFLDVPEARAAAIEVLSRKGVRISELVSRHLESRDPDTKSAAAIVLSRIGERNHLVEILDLSEPDPAAAAAAMESLGRAGDAAALDTLIQSLRHPDVTIRRSAVSALASMRDESVRRRCLALISDADPLVRESVVRVLGSRFDRDTGLVLNCCRDPDVYVRCAAFEVLGDVRDPRVFALVSDAMTSASAASRTAAVQTLGEINDAAAVPLLKTALNDADPWIRYFGARALGKRRIGDLIDTLLSMAEFDTSFPARAAAIGALGALKATAALPLLIRLATDGDPDQKNVALAALGEFTDPRILSILLTAANATESSTRLAAIGGLEMQSDDKAADGLHTLAANDSDPIVSKAAIESLSRSPASSAVDALLSLTQYPMCRDDCVRVLAEVDSARLVRVATGLKHESVDVRRATIEALSRNSDPLARDWVRIAANDPCQSIGMAAEKCLKHVVATAAREVEC